MEGCTVIRRLTIADAGPSNLFLVALGIKIRLAQIQGINANFASSFGFRGTASGDTVPPSQA
jgi:hypothetical protein